RKDAIELPKHPDNVLIGRDEIAIACYGFDLSVRPIDRPETNSIGIFVTGTDLQRFPTKWTPASDKAGDYFVLINDVDGIVKYALFNNVCIDKKIWAADVSKPSKAITDRSLEILRAMGYL
ncbi:MAG TPA: hypothetical protein VLT35_06270, partial [Methanocella sp.]|nr:hypothetical protein [Methanocella sp.]